MVPRPAKPSKPSEAKPAVIFWVESSHTPSHLERATGVIQGLVREGVHVVLVASDTTFSAAMANGGDLQAFGIPKEVEIVPLPTECAGEAPGRVKQENPEYALWQYMNDPAVTTQRNEQITQAIGSLGKRGYKVSHILTEMWPTGFGMFSNEIIHLQRVAKRHFPAAKLCPIVRDIPVFEDGSQLNDRGDQVRRMHQYCDRLLVRGDKGVLEEYYKDHGIARVRDRIMHVGHFISPGVPPRHAMAENQRTVLVSAGGNFSHAPRHQNDYFQYYMQVMDSKPMTTVKDRPWLVCVPKVCPQELYEEIRKKAEKIGGITVRRNMPVEQHRQAVADCALNITVTGYSGMLSGIEAGVPTVVVPALYQKPEFHLDILERGKRYADKGLVTQITMNELQDVNVVAARINTAMAMPLPERSALPDMRGTENVVNLITSDLRVDSGACSGRGSRRA